MSKKKKIKRLERENADLRERLKYIEGYFAASKVILQTFDVGKSTAESLTNVFRNKEDNNDSKAEM